MFEAGRHRRAWSWGDVAIRKGKIAAFAAERLARWTFDAARWPAPVLAGDAQPFQTLAHAVRIPIFRARADRPEFEEGKRINVTLAAPCFDGLLLRADTPFSFWRTLGRTTEARGFQHGMELAGGCVIPTLGGGICLLSNALFRAAAVLGWRIVERHGHTLEVVPPAPGELWGLDATVFWPYVDLVVAPRQDVLLTARVADDHLNLEIRMKEPPASASALEEQGTRTFTEHGQAFRENRIVRRTRDLTSGQESVEVIATNRMRLMSAEAPRRNCFSCGETTCHARPAFLREQS